MKTVKIGRQSAGFVARGHPWVRPDRFTSGLAQVTCGEAVILVDENGRGVAAALADPQAAVCARVYHQRTDRVFDPAAAVAAAWQRRAALHADAGTDCYRLAHGEADFLPGLRIERYASTVVVVVTAACARPWVDATCAALRTHLPAAEIVVKEHLDDLRREDVRTRRWLGPQSWSDAVDPEADVWGRELGVAVVMQPGGGLATGLYVDQRANRVWLRTLAPGRRVLNLFGYTGVFAVSLLHVGAAHACDVDLSAPALRRGQLMAQRNQVTDRYSQIQADCAAFLRERSDAWDFVICDPPTAAQGGEGWLARRDYPALVELALRRLAPGGVLFACLNTQGGKPLDLAALFTSAAERAAVVVTTLEVPALAEDIPQRRGFPEGRPFQAVAVRRSG